MKAEYTLAPEAQSVAEARTYVRDALAPQVSEERLGEVLLVVSELVTNAVRHGPGNEPVTLRLSVDDRGAVAGEVIDRGNGTVAVREQDTDTAVGGLGLPIVDKITTDWGVFPGSTHVWFRLDP